MKKSNLTEGKILSALISFAVPIFLATLLQFLYGMVDMLIVSRFASTAEASGVTTGTAVMNMVISVVSGLTTGVCVVIARRVGERNEKEIGKAICGSVVLFSAIAVVFSGLLPVCAGFLARLMEAPADAYEATVMYIKITGVGIIFLVAYNVLGGIFRGMGDGRTPLIAVIIATVFNLILDVIAVRFLGMGAAGAAFATVAAQGISVLVSVVIVIKRRALFSLSWKMFAECIPIIKSILRLGIPIAAENLLATFSFVAIQAMINGLGLAESVGAGIGDKIGGILLLLPISYLQAMSAFVSQNIGAGKPERARRGLGWGILTALGFGAITSYISIFHGDILASLFTSEADVIEKAHMYIASAYGADCIFTSILFCMMGYFNGKGKTTVSLVQGMIGAFAIRLPYALIANSMPGTNIFYIGLAAPVSSFFQIIICAVAFWYIEKKES